MVSIQGCAEMKKLPLVAALLLATLTTPLLAQPKSWVLSDEEVAAERLEERYGCSGIIDIEHNWHKVYIKNGYQNFIDAAYGYAIERTQKELKRLKVPRIHIRIKPSESMPSVSLIGMDNHKYSTHLTLLFLQSMPNYKK